MPIGGNRYQDILTKRFRILKYAFPGLPSTDSTYAGQLGLRKSAQFGFDPQVDMSTEGREFIYGHLVKAPIEFMQTDYETFKTIYFLAQYFGQYWAYLADGKVLNFVDDTDTSTPHDPNGSLLLSMGEPTFEVDPKTIGFKAELGGLLYTPNEDWMLDNTTLQDTAASGTGPSGVDQLTYDPSKFSIPGFYDLLIGTVTPTDSFGVRNSTKATFKWTKQEEDEQMRAIVRSMSVDIECNILQSILTNWQVINSYRNSDFVFKMPLRNGTTHIFNNSLSIVAMPEYSDKNTPIKVRLKGEIPFDPIGTQANIVFDDVNKTITWNRVGYDV